MFTYHTNRFDCSFAVRSNLQFWFRCCRV